MKRNFSTVLIGSIMSLSLCLPSFSQNLTKSDVENSEEYLKNKAEIKYTKVGSETIREVYIKGFRVNDKNLPSLVNDKALEAKIGSAVSSRRATWVASAGLGIPAGGVLLYLAASSRSALPVNNRPVPLGQTGVSQGTDFKTFAFGTLGAIVTLYAVVNSISLINDMTGLNSPQVLQDKDAESIVQKYNDNLKDDILNKVSNNLSTSVLSEGSNNIMILNVNKSF